MDAEDLELARTIVMRDNDVKYTAQFDDVLSSGGAEVKRCTPCSPNLRAHVERFIQSLRLEAALQRREISFGTRAFAAGAHNGSNGHWLRQSA